MGEWSTHQSSHAKKYIKFYGQNPNISVCFSGLVHSKLVSWQIKFGKWYCSRVKTHVVIIHWKNQSGVRCKELLSSPLNSMWKPICESPDFGLVDSTWLISKLPFTSFLYCYNFITKHFSKLAIGNFSHSISSSFVQYHKILIGTLTIIQGSQYYWAKQFNCVPRNNHLISSEPSWGYNSIA